MKDKKRTKAEDFFPLQSVKDLDDYDAFRFLEIEKKRADARAEGKQILENHMKKVNELRAQLLEKTKVIERLEADWIKTLKKRWAEEKALLDKKNLTQADVVAGKITLDELIKKGKKADVIDAEASKTAMEELAGINEEIRVRRAEIMKLDCQCEESLSNVYYVRLRPTMECVKEYKKHAESLQFSIDKYVEYHRESSSAVIQKKHQLQMLEPKHMGGNFKFNGLTQDEAYLIATHPGLPEHLIPELFAQIPITIPPISITIHMGRGRVETAELTVEESPKLLDRPGIITTAQLGRQQKKSDKENKLLTTHDLDAEGKRMKPIEKEVKKVEKQMLTTHDIDLTKGAKYVKKVKEE